MPRSKSHASAGSRRVLRHPRPSLRARFVQPVVAEHSSLFLLSTEDRVRVGEAELDVTASFRAASLGVIQSRGVPGPC